MFVTGPEGRAALCVEAEGNLRGGHGLTKTGKSRTDLGNKYGSRRRGWVLGDGVGDLKVLQMAGGGWVGGSGQGGSRASRSRHPRWRRTLVLLIWQVT